MTLKHILAPVSSGLEARNSLRRISATINELRAELTLIRILDPFREGGPKPAAQEWEAIQPEQFGVERLHYHVQAHPDPVSGLASYAFETKMDAIMMPHGPVTVFPKGPVFSKRLLLESPCPVWVLDGRGRPGHAEQRVQKVLCAVTGGDLEVVKFAAALCERLGARLFLLHVVPEVSEGLLAYGLDENVALTTAKGMELLADLQKRAGVNAQPIVEMGSTNAGIRRAAKTLNADLIVTARRHYQSIKQDNLLSRLFVQPLLRPMPCHVLAV